MIGYPAGGSVIPPQKTRNFPKTFYSGHLLQFFTQSVKKPSDIPRHPSTSEEFPRHASSIAPSQTSPPPNLHQRVQLTTLRRNTVCQQRLCSQLLGINARALAPPKNPLASSPAPLRQPAPSRRLSFQFPRSSRPRPCAKTEHCH